MTRLSKFDRMTAEEKAQEVNRFWNSSDDVCFPPETVAAVLEVSPSWLQAKRCSGGGIPFTKISERKIRYIKADIVDYYNKRKVNHTSMNSGC
ncbi:DNA-binding protein [Acinetobacter sp.]|uniref:DNA-binding protein n=1 Tax=Acinetobacter sp. TaxID=472 RepID=UPI00258A1A02|nr:DNA-binding protein [Acinetobacter sp.]